MLKEVFKVKGKTEIKTKQRGEMFGEENSLGQWDLGAEMHTRFLISNTKARTKYRT